jgi:hypothetical protein
MALLNVRVEPTAAGASADVEGILDDEPMCMWMPVSVSSHAAEERFPVIGVDRRQARGTAGSR